MANFLQDGVADTNNQNNDGGLDLKEILYLLLGYWPWFLACVFICLLGAFFYLRYTTPVYNITSKILITDNNGSSASGSQDALSQMNILNSQNNVNNEKEVLQTHYMIQKIVNELQLNISYFTVGNIKSTELY